MYLPYLDAIQEAVATTRRLVAREVHYFASLFASCVYESILISDRQAL